jgi:uncharacterized membrane protein
LPIIAFIFQWFSITSPDKGYQGSSNLLFYIGVIFIILAFITGKAAGPDVKPPLTIAGQDLVDTLKEIGTYLTFAFVLLMFLKFFSSKITNEGAKSIVMILMVVALVGLFYEIKSGTALVYDYGAGTQMQYAN